MRVRPELARACALVRLVGAWNRTRKCARKSTMHALVNTAVDLVSDYEHMLLCSITLTAPTHERLRETVDKSSAELALKEQALQKNADEARIKALEEAAKQKEREMQAKLKEIEDKKQRELEAMEA